MQGNQPTTLTPVAIITFATVRQLGLLICRIFPRLPRNIHFFTNSLFSLPLVLFSQRCPASWSRSFDNHQPKHKSTDDDLSRVLFRWHPLCRLPRNIYSWLVNWDETIPAFSTVVLMITRIETRAMKAEWGPRGGELPLGCWGVNCVAALWKRRHKTRQSP